MLFSVIRSLVFPTQTWFFRASCSSAHVLSHVLVSINGLQRRTHGVAMLKPSVCIIVTTALHILYLYTAYFLAHHVKCQNVKLNFYRAHAGSRRPSGSEFQVTGAVTENARRQPITLNSEQMVPGRVEMASSGEVGDRCTAIY